MTRCRRWPLHPAPIDGEALSSWLRRIADCYGTGIEGLGADIGYNLAESNVADIIDLVPAPAMIAILAERTGITPVRIRQMSVAGWTPWLLDDMDYHADGFETYARQLSVLRPAGKHKTRQVSSWRPWLSDRMPARACPECVTVGPFSQSYQLLWAIPIVSTCPLHQCWLAETIGARGYYGIWGFDRPIPRPAPEQILALDQRTRDAFRIGHVDLPHRRVHAGIWFRLLRAIVDELSCPISESRPSTATVIRQVWKEAGYLVRDGQGQWCPYEQHSTTVQQHSMEAAATTVALLENGSITGPGKDAHLFQPAPHIAANDGTPPTTRHASRFGGGLSLMEAFNEAVGEARINPAAARNLFNLSTYKRNDADRIHDVVNSFIDLGIPLDFLSH